MLNKIQKTALATTAAFGSSIASVAAQTDDYYYTTTTTTEGDPLLGGVFLGVSCVGFIIWLVLLVWVYKDAKKRNVASPILWVLLTFFLGLLGLILYLLIGRKGNAGAAPQAPKPVEPAPPTV